MIGLIATPSKVANVVIGIFVELRVPVEKKHRVASLMMQINAPRRVRESVCDHGGIAGIIGQIGDAMIGYAKAGSIVIADLHPILSGRNFFAIKPTSSGGETPVELNLFVFPTGTLKGLGGVKIAFLSEDSESAKFSMFRMLNPIA